MRVILQRLPRDVPVRFAHVVAVPPDCAVGTAARPIRADQLAPVKSPLARTKRAGTRTGSESSRIARLRLEARVGLVELVPAEVDASADIVALDGRDAQLRDAEAHGESGNLAGRRARTCPPALV